MGLNEDTELNDKYEHEQKQIMVFMKMNTDEIETHERDLMVRFGKGPSVFNGHCTQLLTQETVDEEDYETLLLLFVKKYRKLSGDQVQDLKDKLKELTKRRYILEKSFNKMNAGLKKSDRDKIAQQQWGMIGIMQRWLLTYALFDLTI